MMKIIGPAFLFLIQALQFQSSLASDDSPFQLTNMATGFCLVKTNNRCNNLRWTTGDRILVPKRNKCLGAQGKNVGSEVTIYDCDENSELQKWECRNETVLVLKGQELYIELTADNAAVLSRDIGPNSHLTISGTSSGACTRTYREMFIIGGNAPGFPCVFPFSYLNKWYSDCSMVDSTMPWCAAETKYENNGLWGFCPTSDEIGWIVHPITGVAYQINKEASLTQSEAEASCKQQGASLLSITDPHEQAFITSHLDVGYDVWIGLIKSPEHGWKWSNGMPYRYMKWDSVPTPGHDCAILDYEAHYSWISVPCSNQFGYICYNATAEELPTQVVQTGFCSSPWIPYNGHCFHLNRAQRLTWSDAQRECRNQGGDLVSIHNVEEQSFVISQLGYTATDELWIGLNDRTTERLFEWIDHSTVSFTSWELGSPAVSTKIKDCIVIRGENGNWADRGCEETHGFICMKTGASERAADEVAQDDGCTTGWRRHGSYCYYIGTQTKTFDEAVDDCKTSSAYLADVSNALDNAFLISLVGFRSEKHFWLGLSNQKNRHRFVWTNKDSVTFTHWNAAMPGNGQGCVAMTTGISAGLWDVLPCTNREKYICKHLAVGADVTLAPTTWVPRKCPVGWTHLQYRKYCYKLFSQEKKTWYEARDYCRAIGGDLVSIHSSDETDQFAYTHTKFWIGLRAPDLGNSYTWSDGSPLQFQNWRTGEPNNRNNISTCVEFISPLSSTGNWNDVYCETSLPWACQIHEGDTPKLPPGPVTPDFIRTSSGWIEWKGNHYYINMQLMTMNEARLFCQERHGDLAVINSEAENVFLWKQVAKVADHWIGLNADLDGTYMWMDGSPMVFQRWDLNQPRFLSNEEFCVVMTKSIGHWHNKACGFEQRSICKRSTSKFVNITAEPGKAGCPSTWRKYDSKCYKVVHSQKESWEGSKAKCKKMGGSLASIPSRQVQVFLAAAMAEAPHTDLWIGLYNGEGNAFFWDDQQPVQYTNWSPVTGEEKKSYQVYDENFVHYDDDVTGDECAVMSSDPEIGIGKWQKRLCEEKNGYVCHLRADPALPDTSESTVSTNYVNILNDSLLVVTKPLTWSEAKKHCEADGANLVSLRNEWLQFYVEAMALKAPLWIGLNKMETGGYFRFIDGWHLTLANWGSGEPSTERPCVFVDVDLQWKTAHCNRSISSICMKSADVPPTESSDYSGFCPDSPGLPIKTGQIHSWVPFKGYCYLFLLQLLEWSEASVNCARHGGSLASIEDPSEQDFIYRNIKRYADSHTTFWTGLFRTHKGTWKWLDKTVVDYSNWSPHGYEGNFVDIRTADGKWKRANGNLKRGYICKTPKVLRQSPPEMVNPTVDLKPNNHLTLAVALVFGAIAVGAALFLFVKFGMRNLTTRNNRLSYNCMQSQPGLGETNTLVAEEKEEGLEPVVSI